MDRSLLSRPVTKLSRSTAVTTPNTICFRMGEPSVKSRERTVKEKVNKIVTKTNAQCRTQIWRNPRTFLENWSFAPEHCHKSFQTVFECVQVTVVHAVFDNDSVFVTMLYLHWICSCTTRAKWSVSRMRDSFPKLSLRRIYKWKQRNKLVNEVINIDMPQNYSEGKQSTNSFISHCVNFCEVRAMSVINVTLRYYFLLRWEQLWHTNNRQITVIKSVEFR